MVDRVLSPGVAAPKPRYEHPADISLRKITRQLAQSAEFATSGEFSDLLDLALATKNLRLRQTIVAVKNVHARQPGVPAKIIESELVRRKRTDRVGARIITAAIRRDQGKL